MHELRQLAYGGLTDQFDEHLCITESTGRECLKHFFRAVIAAFGDEYLRKPTSKDVDRLVQMHEAKHGFPRMLGSIDCMHWPWKNYPTAWKAAHANYKKGCTMIILETVASYDLWIWHPFYGVTSSNNDINVLNQSDLFSDYLKGVAPAVNFTASNKQYKMGYYPADVIYPKWPTFVKTVPCPKESKSELFAQKQVSASKDIERAFGVLQARWAIIRGAASQHYVKILTEIMYIMHNMIVEDEGDQAKNWEDDEASSSSGNQTQARLDVSFANYMTRHAEI